MKQKSLGVKARKRIGSVVYHCFMVLLSLTMASAMNSGFGGK